MQIPYNILSEVPVPDIQWRNSSVWEAANIPAQWAERAGRDTGTEYPAGSYPYGDRNTAEVCGEFGVRVSEREVSIEAVSAV